MQIRPFPIRTMGRWGTLSESHFHSTHSKSGTSIERRVKQLTKTKDPSKVSPQEPEPQLQLDSIIIRRPS